MAIGASSGARINNADGKIVIGTSVDMYGMNQGLAKIEKSWKRLGKVTGGAIGIIGLLKFGKAALDAASDLQEVQNIVDVAFGDMSYKMENFAATAIDKFGMSRLAAKQTGGSFMAMGKSMGLTMEEASDMAISLTGLTADMASFYNISQDYARVALSAVYTGETETLKRYGIVLTEANLQQFAQTKGIQGSVKAMDARSKALLRYQYILESTKDMQGDFERTSGTWANQVRLLKQQWTEFLNVVGTGLITILTPLLKIINAIIRALTKMAQVIGATLSRIFGIKWGSFSSGASQAGSSLSDTADSADDAAAGIGKVGDATKKATKEAKKALAPWDDLNVLMQDTADAASGSSSGGGAGGADFKIPEYDMSDLGNFDDWLKGFDSLFDLGRWISEKLEAALRSIDWEKIYEGARNFGTGLAEFLNGLITPGLFGAVGMTIASALNTAIYAALSFGETFDWKNLGESLAAGINEFFETFDFKALAQTINVWVQGIYTTIKEFISNVKWDEVWQGVKDFLGTIELDTVEIIIAALVLKKLGKLIVSGELLKIIEGALMTKLIKPLGEAIWLGLSGQIQILAGLGAGMGDAFVTVFGATLGPVVQVISGLVAVIGGAIIAVKNFVSMWQEGWDILKTIFEAIGIALVTLGVIILAPIEGIGIAIAALVAAVVFAVSQIAIVIHDHWDQIKEWFAGVGEWFNTNVITPIVNFFRGLWETVSGFFVNLWNDIMAVWMPVATWFNDNVIQPIVGWFQSAWQTIQDVFYTLWIILEAIWIVASTWVEENIIIPITTSVNEFVESVKQLLTNLWTSIQGIYLAVKTWVYSNVIMPVVSDVVAFANNVKQHVENLWTNIKNILSKIKSWVDTNVVKPLKDLFDKLWDSIKSGFKSMINLLIGNIEKFLNGIINIINVFLSGLDAVGRAAATISGAAYTGITPLQNVSFPRLAKGAVIPPNKEFMAILGDQRSGTNIEAPLDTIVQAMQQALASQPSYSGPQEVVLEIDGNELARLTLPYNLDELHRRGYNVNVLEV